MFSSDAIVIIGLVVLFFLTAVTVGYYDGYYDGKRTALNEIRTEAIEAGVGEYYLNKETQEKDFRWIITVDPPISE